MYDERERERDLNTCEFQVDIFHGNVSRRVYSLWNWKLLTANKITNGLDKKNGSDDDDDDTSMRSIRTLSFAIFNPIHLLLGGFLVSAVVIGVYLC